MYRRVQWLLTSLILIAALGCLSDDTPSGLTNGPGGEGVTLETSRAVSDSIGAAGGELIATGSNGVTYTLTIPAGALITPVKITMTPIAEHANLPGSIEFAAGVTYEPGGLALAQPLRLTATPVRAAPAGKRTAALSFQGDGDSLALTPNGLSGATLTAFVPHFSGTSFVYGTSADLLTIAAAGNTSSVADQFYLNQLSALGNFGDQPFPAALPIVQAWFANVILPQLQGAGTDAELILAVQDYSFWRGYAEVYLTGGISGPGFPAPAPVLPALATEVGQARQAVAPQLRNAIAGNNSVCLTKRNVQAMFNVFFWQAYATFFRVDTPTEQLDPATVAANLCARIVADSVGLANPLPVGQGASLDMVWGLLIGGTKPILPSDFRVNLSVTGTATAAPASSLTGPNPQGGPITQGFFTSVITATGPSANITATACLVPPTGQFVLPNFCGSVNINRGAPPPPPPGCGVVINGSFDLNSAAQLTQLANVSEITGDLGIAGGSAGLIDLPCLRRIRGALRVFNFTVNGVTTPFSSPGIIRLPAVDTVGGIRVQAAGLTIVDIPALRFVGSSTGRVDDVQVGGNADLASFTLGSVGFTARLVNFTQNPKLTSLAFGALEIHQLSISVDSALRTVSIASVKGFPATSVQSKGDADVFIASNPLLTGLTIGPYTGKELLLRNNPSLQSLGNISSSTTIERFRFDLANGFTESVALAFANRITVTGNVCSASTANVGFDKCYQGPPWIP